MGAVAEKIGTDARSKCPTIHRLRAFRQGCRMLIKLLGRSRCHLRRRSHNNVVGSFGGRVHICTRHNAEKVTRDQVATHAPRAVPAPNARQFNRVAFLKLQPVHAVGDARNLVTVARNVSHARSPVHPQSHRSIPSSMPVFMWSGFTTTHIIAQYGQKVTQNTVKSGHKEMVEGVQVCTQV